jgi:hypothetical protein
VYFWREASGGDHKVGKAMNLRFVEKFKSSMEPAGQDLSASRLIALRNRRPLLHSLSISLPSSSSLVFQMKLHSERNLITGLGERPTETRLDKKLIH